MERSHAGDERQLLELLDEARVGEAARSRVRRRWLRQQATEGATFAGTLTDLAERGTEVAVRTAGGRTWTGYVDVVALDAVVVRAGGTAAYLAMAAVAWVRAGEGATAATGHRPGRDITLGELLAPLAADRPTVAIATCGGGEPLRGTLLGAGVDVLTVRPDGERCACYVPLQSVSELVTLASG